jgi:hypothetical protein
MLKGLLWQMATLKQLGTKDLWLIWYEDSYTMCSRCFLKGLFSTIFPSYQDTSEVRPGNAPSKWLGQLMHFNELYQSGCCYLFGCKVFDNFFFSSFPFSYSITLVGVIICPHGTATPEIQVYFSCSHGMSVFNSRYSFSNI